MNTILITGAGSGLGKELALQYAQKGYHLMLTGRTIEKLNSVKTEIEAIGGKADVLPLDIRNANEIKQKLAELSKSYRFVGLVNNAGVGHFGPFEQITDHEITEILQTNVYGTIFMTRELLPYLLKMQEGQIINIISTAGLRGKIHEAVYAASKFAIRGFTESLQKEYENSALKITAVYMGGMNTPFWSESSHVKDPTRFWSPAEVAKMIFEQLSEESIVIEGKKS